MKKTKFCFLSLITTFIVAIVCAVCSFSFSTTTKAATTQFTISGNGGGNVNASRYYVILESDYDWTGASATQIEINVNVNGVDSTVKVWANGVADAKLDIQVPTSAVAQTGAYATVTIPGGTVIGTCTLSADYTFYLWNGAICSEADTKPFTVTSLGGIATNHASQNRYYVVLNTVEGTFSTDAYWANNYVYTISADGTKTPVSVNFTPAGNHLALIVTYANLGFNALADVNTTLYIPAGTVIGPASASGRAKVTEDIYLRIEGSSVTKQDNFAFTHGAQQDASNRYLIYFKHPAATTTSVWKTTYNITIDDTTATTADVYDAGNGTHYFMTLGYVKTPKAEYHKVTVNAGWTVQKTSYVPTEKTFYVYNGTVYAEDPMTRIESYDYKGYAVQSNRYLVYFNETSNANLTALGSVKALIDDETEVSLEWYNWTNGNYALLLPFTVASQEDTHKVTLLAEQSGLLTAEEEFTFWTDNGIVVLEEPIKATEYAITTENATIKMGGEYGENAYYHVVNNFSGAGWIVNNVETTESINVNYNVLSETRTAGGTYGVTRMWRAQAAWDILDYGVVDYTQNNNTNTWYTMFAKSDILLQYNATTHRRVANGNSKWGYPQTNVAAIKNVGDGGGNPGLTTAYEKADELGAKHFGLAWGGGTYNVDYQMMIYDNYNNDLGVRLSSGSAQLMGAIGQTIYFTPNVKYLGEVVVTTEDGRNVSVTKNGDIYSFVMPEDEITITVSEAVSTAQNLTIENATLKVGGEYGDNLYYHVTGTWSNVGYIVNDMETTGSINVNYNVLSETRTAGGVYGVARMWRADTAWDIIDYGVVDFTQNANSNATWASMFGVTDVSLQYNSATHRRTANGTSVWGYPSTNVAEIKGVNDAGGNPGLTTAYAKADELGAVYFGIAWGGGTHSVDYKMLITDDNNNDLGVRLSTTNLTNGSVALKAMTMQRIYIVPKEIEFAEVLGIRGINADGEEVEIYAKDEGNGIWSFEMPLESITVSPIYSKTSVSITTGNGTAEKDILWSKESFVTAFSKNEIESSTLRVIDYTYNGQNYTTIGEVYDAIMQAGSIPNDIAIQINTVHLETVYGASIRLVAANPGIRFSAKIKTNAQIVSFGMLFTDEETKNEVGELNINTIQHGVNGYNINSLDEGFKSYVDKDGFTCFSVVLSNLSLKNFNKNFTARTYVVVKYADGTEEVIYATYSDSDNIRSAYYVANKAIVDLEDDLAKATTTAEREKLTNEIAILQSYIDGVLDIDSASFGIRGEERNYTITGNTKQDGKVCFDISELNGFDINKIGAFCLDGVRVSAEIDYTAKKIYFDLALWAASDLLGAIQENADAYNGGVLEELDIMSYFGPSLGIYMDGNKLQERRQVSTIEDIKKYFDAGFTYLSGDEAWHGAYRYEGIEYGSGVEGEKYDSYHLLDLVACYADYYGLSKEDVPVLIAMPYLQNAQNGQYGGSGQHTEEQIRINLQAMLNELKGYKPQAIEGYVPKGELVNCFGGMLMLDEPRLQLNDKTCSDTNNDGSITIEDKINHYNKWYNYMAEELGMIDDGYLLVGAILSVGANYKYIEGSSNSIIGRDELSSKYINGFINGITSNGVADSKEFIMTDRYPFRTKITRNRQGSLFNYSNTWTYEYFYSPYYFSTLELYANKAKANGINAGICIQSVTHYNKNSYESVLKRGYSKDSYDFVGQIDQNGNLTMGANHIKMQAYTALAYGYKKIDFYTYWQHFNNVAEETIAESAVMWDENGNVKYMPMYDHIKAANTEVSKFDEIVMAFDWQGTRLVTGASATCNSFGEAVSYSGSAVANTLTATYDAAVGCFTFQDYFGYMIVNVDHPQYNRANAVSINLGDYNYAICYINGKPVVKALTDGKLELNVACGGGIFVVPVNIQ